MLVYTNANGYCHSRMGVKCSGIEVLYMNVIQIELVAVVVEVIVVIVVLEVVKLVVIKVVVVEIFAEVHFYNIESAQTIGLSVITISLSFSWTLAPEPYLQATYYCPVWISGRRQKTIPIIKESVKGDGSMSKWNAVVYIINIHTFKRLTIKVFF